MADVALQVAAVRVGDVLRFRRPESGKIAVKVINHYGDEVLQVYDV